MIEITPLQARVIGSLIEKEITTPEQYPLSLNALTLACNQKSNREPVVDLDQSEVQNLVDELVNKNLVAEVLFGSRVPKYKHRFCNTEFSQLHFDAKSLGILCVLFLRGPQTPGELRARTNRLCSFRDVEEVEETLAKLAAESTGVFVEKLPRVPGKRESRFRHLFFHEHEREQVNDSLADSDLPLNSPQVLDKDLASRVEQLENQVLELRSELESLRAAWDDLNS